MADEMSPEQIAELQRKNCIFCKIIAGEIESKKVFENEDCLGILDIRPAAPGHVLFMPKEHVPILPVLSEEKMITFLKTAVQVAGAVQEAMIVPRMTILAASGYAAGQQAPHLMLHLIPREQGDGLEMLDLEELTVPQADTLAIASIFSEATRQALVHRKREDLTKQHHIHKKQPTVTTAVPVDTPAGPTLVKAKGEGPAAAIEPSTGDVPVVDEEHGEETVEFDTVSEALQSALAMSPDLRKLVIAQPDLVQDYVKRSPKFAKLFEGVDIHALSMVLQRQEATQPIEQVASDMTDAELFKFIDGNEGLRTWMIEQPDELAARIPENPRLQKFFNGIDIKETARKYRNHRMGL